MLHLKYILNEKYLICGWDNAECAIVNLDSKTVNFISEIDFKLLLLCNGKIDLDQIKYFNKNIISKYLKSGIINISDGRQEREIVYKKYNNRYVECFQWSITGKCNSKCRHCYLNSPNQDYDELSEKEIKSIVHQLVKCGIFKVKITGGEPLVSPYFWFILEELIKNDICIEEIYTNGYLVNDRFFYKLSELDIKPIINMSYDGIGSHDWLRGINGAENAVNKAFELCRKYGFISKAEMCLHKGNIGTLRDSVNHLASLGVQQVKIGIIFNTELWLSNCENNSIDIKNFYDACIDYLPRYFEDKPDISISIGYIYKYNKSNKKGEIPTDIEFSDLSVDKQYLCKSCRTTMYLLPNGTLLPCMVAASLPKSYFETYPNLKIIGLQEALKFSDLVDFMDMNVQDLIKHNEACAKCNDLIKCHGGCRLQAMLDNSGDIWSCDKIMCDYYSSNVNKKVRETISKIFEVS